MVWNPAQVEIPAIAAPAIRDDLIALIVNGC